MKLAKAIFMVLRALLLVLVGSVLWALVGINWLIDKSEDKVLGIVKKLGNATSKMFKNVKRHVVNFAINFETFADAFHSEAVAKTEEMYKELMNGFKIRKEIIMEDRRILEEEEEVTYYPVP